MWAFQRDKNFHPPSKVQTQIKVGLGLKGNRTSKQQYNWTEPDLPPAATNLLVSDAGAWSGGERKVMAMVVAVIVFISLFLFVFLAIKFATADGMALLFFHLLPNFQSSQFINIMKEHVSVNFWALTSVCCRGFYFDVQRRCEARPDWR